MDRPDVSFPVVDIEETKKSSDVEDPAPVEKPAIQKPEVDTETPEQPSEDGDAKMEGAADPVEEKVDSEPETDEAKPEKIETDEDSQPSDAPVDDEEAEESE